MIETCPEPTFRYHRESGWWGPCGSCGELARSHAQADPLGDIKNSMRIAAEHLDPADFPPVVRPPHV